MKVRYYWKKLLVSYWQKSIGIIYQIYRKKQSTNKLSRKIISISEATRDECITKIIEEKREKFRKEFKEYLSSSYSKIHNHNYYIKNFQNCQNYKNSNKNPENIQRPFFQILPLVKEMQTIILTAAKIHPSIKKNSPSKK